MLSAGQDGPPLCLPEFDHINRYWDKVNKIYAAKILPGEFYATLSDEAVVTVLGSCVSACVRDRVFGIGGMNHFMLPKDTGCDYGGKAQLLNLSTRYGSYAMESLINVIMKNGGRRENLEFKVFGGGRIIKGMSDVGLSNIKFIRDFLHAENFEIVAEDLGGDYPRKLMYYPASGRVRMKKLRSLHNDTILVREDRYRHELEHPVEGDVELFD